MERLAVFHDNNSVFADNSFAAFDFGRDTFTLDLVAADDFLYIGLYKNFNKFYVEFSTVNTVANSFTAEFSDAGGFSSIDNFIDNSKGFTRNGFIEWDREQTDWIATTINGLERFWVRLKPNSDHDVGTAIQGLNIVFADDEDLKEEYAGITDFFLEGATSFILYHQAVRKMIVQKLRNQGKAKQGNDDTFLQNVTEWDLLEPQEIREAAKFYVLEKIFDNISDSTEDKEWQLARKYGQQGDTNYANFLKVDLDDDGIESSGERTVLNKVRIERR